MSEEQFWRSNPRIIAVWERAYQEDMSFKNSVVHSMVGTYGISALTFAIDHCLNGRKAKAKYMKEPMDLFPQDKNQETQVENARSAFMAWAESMKNKYKKANEEGG